MINLKKNYEQTEQFDAHKNILNNLIPGENILYQLKSYKLSSGTYYEYQLYNTNIKICIIHKVDTNDERIYYINLNDLQCISFRKRGFTSENKDSGKIEFISEKIKNYTNENPSIKRHSHFFYVSKNLQNIIKILESLLWHFSNVNDRLDKLRNKEVVQIPKEFRNFLKNNRVFIPQKKSPEGIEFNQNLYLTYSTSIFGSNTSFGKIIFKPSFNSKIKIKCKYHNDSLKVLELIYFLSLFWKFKNNSLTSKKTLLDLHLKINPNNESSINKDILKNLIINKICYKCGTKLRNPYESCPICGSKLKIIRENEKDLFPLQDEQLKYERKRYFEGSLKNSERSELTEKLYTQYERYLNKDEKILLYYKEKIFNTLSLSVSFLALIAIISIFLMIFLSVGFIILFLFTFIGLCALPFLFTFNSCTFTSQKIIFKTINMIGTTTYNNVISIEYKNINNMQHIYFELNLPMDSNEVANKTSFSLTYIPKELNLYNKIIEIRNQFKN